jgi:hypothetical protein
MGRAEAAAGQVESRRCDSAEASGGRFERWQMRLRLYLTCSDGETRQLEVKRQAVLEWRQACDELRNSWWWYLRRVVFRLTDRNRW